MAGLIGHETRVLEVVFEMNQPKDILVPVDLSDRSRVAVDYAGMLAKQLGSALTLVTNVNMPELAILEEYAAREGLDIDDAGDTYLRRLADELAPGVAVETVLVHDDFPAEGILSVAKERGADLIVVASHGRSGMTRWLLGSVAEKIARVADVPVMIIPARH